MESSTFAIVATELVIEDKYFGLIKFEMTTHTRKWSKENISVLNLLAKILATKYSKEYDAFIHYKQMYFDQETNLFNFHKWFDDVTLVLNENETKKNITKYTILDIGIMKFSTLVSIAGIKTVLKILKTIAKALINLEDLGIIYCRSYENRFTLFVPNDDTFLVKNIFKRVVNALDELELDDKVGIRAGYYIVDALENKLSLDEVVDRAVTARKKANR